VSEPIRFDDGPAYERYMGKWSQLVGATFLNWLAPKPGLRWLDVGCGNGAFTETLVEQCAPALVRGMTLLSNSLPMRERDPRCVARSSCQRCHGAVFPGRYLRHRCHALVIFFVPDPATGLAEMARVVSPGGMVAAYAWDMDGGGFPYDLLRTEMAALGREVRHHPALMRRE